MKRNKKHKNKYNDEVIDSDESISNVYEQIIKIINSNYKKERKKVRIIVKGHIKRIKIK